MEDGFKRQYFIKEFSQIYQELKIYHFLTVFIFMQWLSEGFKYYLECSDIFKFMKICFTFVKTVSLKFGVIKTFQKINLRTILKINMVQNLI